MTTTIRSAQMVFAKVERERSPNRKPDYQTLYHTKRGDLGLSTSDVMEIEARLVHDPGDVVEPRYLSIKTKEGRWAIATFGSLDEADRFGRAARYFAHVLVLSEPEFKKVGFDPFAVIRAGVFAATLEEATPEDKCTFKTGEIEPAEIAVEHDEDLGDTAWAERLGAAGVLALLRAACRASRPRADRRTIALVGEPVEVNAVLAGLFAALPPDLRKDCGFDTRPPDRAADRQGFWAVGLAQCPPRSNLQAFSLKDRRFVIPQPAEQPETPFERWLVHAFQAADSQETVGQVGHLVRDVTIAYGLGKELEGVNHAPFLWPSAELSASFEVANDAKLGEKLDWKINDLIKNFPPPWLHDDATAWIRKMNHGAPRLQAWRTGPNPKQVAEWTQVRLERSPREGLSFRLDLLLKQCGNDGSDNVRFLEMVQSRLESNWGTLERRFRDLSNRADNSSGLFIAWLVKSFEAKIQLATYTRDQVEVKACIVRKLGGRDGGFGEAIAAILASSDVQGGQSALAAEPLHADNLLTDRTVSAVPRTEWEGWIDSVRKTPPMKIYANDGWHFQMLRDGFIFGYGQDKKPEQYAGRSPEKLISRSHMHLLRPRSRATFLAVFEQLCSEATD